MRESRGWWRWTSVSFAVVAAVALVAGSGAAAGTPPLAPTGEELTAGPDSSVTITWARSAGATSYHIYRGTRPGGEGTVPIGTTTGTTYRDSNLSPKPVYFYEVTAANSAGESVRTPEDATRTPPPIGTGGAVAGTRSGNGTVYYAKDALLGGFDWFQTLTGWFPQLLGPSAGSVSPGKRVVDMAYSTKGTMTFTDVVVPASGLYTVDWRYAFQSGLFPGVNNRRMGLSVNGKVVTTAERFPITGGFDTYRHSLLQVYLRAGANSITLFAVTGHGVPRLDQLTVTPATASAPSPPTNLTTTSGDTRVTLTWTPSATGDPTSYSIYRGIAADGEANVAIGTTSGTATTFTDTGLHDGTKYFYAIAANNSVGESPDSNEAAVTVGTTDRTSHR